MTSPRKESSGPGSFYRYSQAGLQFGLTVALCTGGGYWLDRNLGTRFVFIILGTMFGAAAAFYHLYRDVFGRK